MKIVVTGANSMLGKNFIQYAVENNSEIVAVMRDESKNTFNNSLITPCYLSMEEYSKLGKVVGSCDCFISFAWNGTRGADRNNEIMQQNNIRFSMDAVESMINAGCKRIVTAGSQAEYGSYSTEIYETSECFPNTQYGKAKLEFYNRVKELCIQNGVEYKEPRFFSVYGPDDYENTMIMQTIKNMLLNLPCHLTEGIQMWDYLYIDDAVEVLYRMCTRECPNGVYNFGSGDTRQLRDYIEEIAQITCTKSDMLYGSIPYPQTGMVSLWPNVEKIKTIFAWEPRVTFKEGIESIVKKLDNDF